MNERVVGRLFWGLVIILFVAMLVSLGAIALNSCMRIELQGTGVVVAREYHMGWTSSRIGESWWLTLKVENQLVEVEVSQKLYEKVSPGMEVEVVYFRGGLSGEVLQVGEIKL